jgi:hypothetical protein
MDVLKFFSRKIEKTWKLILVFEKTDIYCITKNKSAYVVLSFQEEERIKGSRFLLTGNPHGLRVPMNGEPAWAPGSYKRGTRMGSGFLWTGNPHGLQVPMNGEPAWAPSSYERGTRMGSGFLWTGNPYGFRVPMNGESIWVRFPRNENPHEASSSGFSRTRNSKLTPLVVA